MKKYIIILLLNVSYLSATPSPKGAYVSQEKSGGYFSLLFSQGRAIEIIYQQLDKPEKRAMGFYKIKKEEDGVLYLRFYPHEVTSDKWPTKRAIILNVLFDRTRLIDAKMILKNKNFISFNFCLTGKHINGTSFNECRLMKKMKNTTYDNLVREFKINRYKSFKEKQEGKKSGIDSVESK